MSSQTQPQKVHVAFLTTVRSIPCLPLPILAGVRTGRHDEGSAQHPAAKAPPDAARHVPPGINQLPRLGVLCLRFTGNRKNETPLKLTDISARSDDIHGFSVFALRRVTAGTVCTVW